MGNARFDFRIAMQVLALLVLISLIGAGRAAAALPQESGLVDLKTDAAVVMTGSGASGSSVAALGDFNGDGFGDTATAKQFHNSAQVEFGSASTASLDMDALGPRGFQLILSESGGRLFVAKAGDVNGDGIPDLLVAAPNASPPGRSNAGSVFVVFGGPSTSPVDLSNLGARGFRIDGAAANQFLGSNSVAGAEDVNGDGKADIVVGSPTLGADAYVIFGKSGTASVDLANLGPSNQGFVISPPAGQTIGSSGTGEGRPYMLVGDMNGDGKAEVVLGVPGENGGHGGAYVVFGKSSSTPVSLAALGGGGFHISTATPQAGLAGIGQTVGGSCDVNGDGVPDAVVGTNTGGTPPSAGEAIVVFGRSATSDVDLGALGSGGFVIKGAPADYASEWLGSTADLNGDGLCDLVIGAYQAQPSGRSQQDGKGYVVYGKATTGTVDLSSLSASEGYTIIGADSPMYDSAGREIDAGTDFNGDGRPDLIIGASGADGFSGRAYIIYGFGPPPPIQNPNDQLTVEKSEQFIGLGPGETKSVTVSCPTGYLVLDGSPLVQQIDHGLPSFVQILQSASSSPASYTFTLRNPTSGNAQAKGFVTCVRKTTTDGGAITLSPSITATAAVGSGPSSRTLTCPSGSTAVDPGYAFSGGQGRMISSEPTAGSDGWTFTFAEGPANVTLSIRCLSKTTSDGDLLQSQELARTVTVPPGQTVSESVICPVGYKGIVASYSLPGGVFLLGDEPQPISRVFSLENTSSSSKSVGLDLLCLSNTTWHAQPAPPVATPVHIKGRAAIGRGGVRADVACKAKTSCAGSIKLRSRSRLVAGGRFAVRAGHVATVRLKLTRAGRHLTRRRRPRSLRSTIALNGGGTVKQTVRVRK